MFCTSYSCGVGRRSKVTYTAIFMVPSLLFKTLLRESNTFRWVLDTSPATWTLAASVGSAWLVLSSMVVAKFMFLVWWIFVLDLFVRFFCFRVWEA